MSGPRGAAALPLIYCAIDTGDLGLATELSAAVAEAGCGVKLGLEFFNAHGPRGVQTLLENRVRPSIFLDLKYHDIPNTVAGAVKAASSLDVAYLNVHASGGAAMMRQALAACAPKTRLLSVTVLTSLDDSALEEVGQDGPALAQVTRLARLTHGCGLAGVVCSAHEVRQLRNALPDDFILMVPGIRPEGSEAGDQKRIMTPRQAVEAGATHLVIGRPITQAADPAAAAKAILASTHD
ncbi:MAG: orotidine-5'-phosphate decarboxylase [Micavibrio sp.]